MVWANDDLANATALSGPSGSITPLTYDSTVDPATSESGESVTGAGETLWWTWTAPADGNYAFATVGSPASPPDPDGLDTQMQVFSGPASSPTHAALTFIAANDDNTAGDTYSFNSRVIFAAVAGTTYYVQVDQYSSGQAGALHLTWSEITPPVYTWTTAATDTFDRADSTTTINPASDGGTYTVIRGGGGILSNQGYFPVMGSAFDDAVAWRDVGGNIQDVSIDNYRTDTYGSSALILNWDGTSGSGAVVLTFNSSASATISRLSSAPVTFTPWTGGSTTLRVVSYYDPNDSSTHMLVYQDGVQVLEYVETGTAPQTGIAFSTQGHSFRHFDESFDNLVVLTGVLAAPTDTGWQVGSVAMT